MTTRSLKKIKAEYLKELEFHLSFEEPDYGITNTLSDFLKYLNTKYTNENEHIDPSIEYDLFLKKFLTKYPKP